MGAISSLQDAMRVLILSALLAVAAAAPLDPPEEATPVPIIPAPEIDPGDIQAATIDSQVFAEDQARAAAESARAFTEKVVEENNEKVIETTDQLNEKSQEAFWAREEKKWQALDEANIAAAKIDGAVAKIDGAVANIDGAVASNADTLARSTLGVIGVVPGFVIHPAVPVAPPALPVAPVAPVSPIVYAAPGLTKKGEENKELVKTAEPEKQKLDEKPEDKKELEKPAQSENLQNLDKPIIPLIPAVIPGVKYSEPWLASVAQIASLPVAQVAQYGAVAPLTSLTYVPPPLIAPVVKTQW